MRSLRSFALVLGLSLSCGSMGCTPEETKDPIDEPNPDKAMLRIVHASSDAPTVDIWAGDSQLFKGLNYGDASDWLEVDPGDYDVEIKASPSTAEDAAVYKTGKLTVDKGDKISAIAAGLIGSAESGSKFRVLSIREEFSPAGSGNAIARLVHAAADAPSVGLDLHNDDPTSPELTNIDRFTDTDEAGFVLASGMKLQLGVAANGERVTAFTTPELPEGAELLLIATGRVGADLEASDSFSVLAVGPDGAIGFIRQNPFVYALHACPDAPAVDLYSGKTQLASIKFGELAGPVQVPPGDSAIDFRPAGADPSSAPAATATASGLEPGKRFLTIATGFLASNGEDGFRLMSMAESFTDGKDDALIRIVHGAPDAPAVDFGILNVEKVVNPVLVKGLTFGQSAPDGKDFGTGTIPVGVTPAGMNTTVVASFHVQADPGLRAFAVAAGSLTGKGETVRLLAVDTSTSPWTVTTIHPQQMN
jgi:hypothetical protein